MRVALRGFTLVEILVVISIIAILSAVIYANFGQARTEARNKAVRTSLSEVQLALEVYKAQNDRYPVSSSVGGVGLFALVPDYISELPVDTDSANGDTCDLNDSTYITDAGGTYYKLTALNCIGATSASAGVQVDDEMARCPSSCGTCAGSTNNAAYRATAAFYQTIAIYSLGGECR